MPKASEMAKVSAKGGFHMLWGLVVSTIISSVGTIVIGNLLGPENMGLYAIAIGAPNLIANFRDWGINTAIVRYSAQYNSENKLSKIRSVFLAGLVFEIVMGTALTLVSFFLADYLAIMFNRPGIGQLIQISSLFILAGALGNAASSAFTGLEKMFLNSIWYIIQAVLKTGLIIVLILAGFGTLGAVAGFSVSIFLASIASVLLMFTLYRTLDKTPGEKPEILKTTKTMLSYGFPLSIGVIITGFLTYFYTWVMATFVTDNALIGNYAVAQNFVVLITFFATPVTTLMFPAFAKLSADKDQDTLRNVFQYSVKYASLIVLPVTVLVMSLAVPAIGTIYQGRFLEAPLYLALLSITYLYTAIGSLSITNIISGQGHTKYALKLTILTVAIGFPLSFALTALWGIVGLIVATCITSVPSLFLGLRFIQTHFGVSLDWISSVRIGFSSAAAGIVTYLVVELMSFSNPIELAIGVVLFVVAFLFVAIITKTISKADLDNIGEIALALGPLRKPILLLVNLLQRIIAKLNL